MTEATQDRPRRSTLSKILIGGGIGCGVLLMLIVGGCVACTVWLKTPGDVIDPRRLLARDAVAYVEWTIDLDDPGTRDVISALFAKARDAQRRAVPEEGLGRVVGLAQQFANRRNERELGKLLPVVLVATVRIGTDGDPDLVVAASARGMDHQLVLADWVGTPLLRRALNAEEVRHAGETILVLPRKEGEPDVAVFLRGGDAFLATSVDEARRAVDLLAGRVPKESGDFEISRQLSSLPEVALRGVLDNAAGALDRLFADLSRTDADAVSDDAPRGLERVTLSGGLDADTAFAIDVEFDLASPGAAEAAAPALGAWMASRVDETPFRVRDTRVRGARVGMTLVTDPLVERIEALPVDGS